jgi:hypothetical protein
MKITGIIACILWICLSGCESLVTEIPDADLPKTESKLAVQAFIAPENPRTFIVVTQSEPLFGETNTPAAIIRDAVVKLSDGMQEVIVPFDTVNDLYLIEKSKFPIEAGKSYRITVSDAKRTVTSTCVVPQKTTLPTSFEIDTTYSNAPDTTLTLKMKWNDIPGEPNFYRVRAWVDLEYSIADGTSAADFKERRIKNRFNVNWEETIGRDNFRSDANLDGATFTSPLGTLRLPAVSYFNFGNGEIFVVYPKAKIISVLMEVYNTDENYYRYHKSLDNARNSDNPFVEPSLVFTNVNGGLGCFAAYHIGQLVYRPK